MTLIMISLIIIYLIIGLVLTYYFDGFINNNNIVPNSITIILLTIFVPSLLLYILYRQLFGYRVHELLPDIKSDVKEHLDKMFENAESK